jgi:hypothetical protein
MAATKFSAVVDVPLTGAQSASINKAIQSAVLGQMAKIDNGIIGRRIDLLGGGGQTDGIHVKNFATLDALKKNPAFKKAVLPK